jgi:hypothetical protein
MLKGNPLSRLISPTQDELIIFMALAEGTSKIKTGPLSLHTKAAIFFTKHLTGV